jgi:hypothetical protein
MMSIQQTNLLSRHISLGLLEQQKEGSQIIPAGVGSTEVSLATCKTLLRMLYRKQSCKTEVKLLAKSKAFCDAIMRDLDVTGHFWLSRIYH